MRLALLLCLCPAMLAGQAADSGQRGIPLPVTDSALRLPVDRVGDLLPWLPGGSIDPDGRPTWRGLSETQLGRTIDGVFWGNIVRPQNRGSATAPRVMAPAFNALGPSSLLSGAYDVSEGAGGEGILRLTTLAGGDRWVVRGSGESGAPYQHQGGEASSRFDASAGGPLVAGWRIRAAATVLGRESAPAGVGYRSAPYYAPVAIDTTYTFETSPGDTVSALVQRFSTTSRVPTSPRTTTDFATRLDGHMGSATVWGHYLRGTEAERLFSYVDQSNPAQSFGRDGRSQELAAGVALAPIGGWRFEGQASWQEERTQSGPIDPTKLLDSRDPSLGLLTSGVGLAYTLQNFPVDDQLIWNYRLNVVGSRRSPYDLENTSQYALVDKYRNNAYGVLGFDESGGPIGTLNLFRDRRVGGQLRATRPLPVGALTVGIEARVHDIASYSHPLTSQAFSDVWRTKPVEQGGFATWKAGSARWSVTAGLRLDRFNTEARRPKGFPRISSFNGYWIDSTNGDTLRVPMGSLSQETWWDLITYHDTWHSAVSPRIEAVGDVGAGFLLHGSAGRFARVPDLSRQLAGINTDLAITNAGMVFGTDYGYEKTDAIDLGVTKSFATATLDLTLFRQHHLGTPEVQVRQLYDPLKLQDNLLAFWELLPGATETGATLDGRIQVSPAFSLAGTYTYLSTNAFSDPFAGPTLIVAPDSLRPHTLALSATARTPGTGALGGFAAVVSFRRASGVARPIDPGVGTLFFGIARTDGMPGWSSLDLRITKSLPIGRSQLTMYIDARNLLDAENLLRAFWSGNPTRSIAAEASRFSADSAGWAREAANNGAYNNGDILLTFGGAGRSGCGAWVDFAANPNPPNCAYLINAESRFGNGDGVFTLAEQRAASGSYYYSQFGPGAFNGPPHAIRFGVQMGF